jgi:hypothetical protein
MSRTQVLIDVWCWWHDIRMWCWCGVVSRLMWWYDVELYQCAHYVDVELYQWCACEHSSCIDDVHASTRVVSMMWMRALELYRWCACEHSSCINDVHASTRVVSMMCMRALELYRWCACEHSSCINDVRTMNASTRVVSMCALVHQVMSTCICSSSHVHVYQSVDIMPLVSITWYQAILLTDRWIQEELSAAERAEKDVAAELLVARASAEKRAQACFRVFICVCRCVCMRPDMLSSTSPLFHRTFSFSIVCVSFSKVFALSQWRWLSQTSSLFLTHSRTG